MAERFNGVIGLDVRDSVADWDAFTADQAPEGAPNVLVVLSSTPASHGRGIRP